VHPIERAVAVLEANVQTLRLLLEGGVEPQEMAQSLAEVERCEEQAAEELRRLL
jgi:hypothetical protein